MNLKLNVILETKVKILKPPHLTSVHFAIICALVAIYFHYICIRCALLHISS